MSDNSNETTSVQALPEPINFAILTARDTNQCKTLFINDKGMLDKESSANPTTGNFKQYQAGSMAELNAKLEKLTAKQSLVIGTPHRQDGKALQTGESINLTTKRNPRANAIPRTKEFIKYRNHAGLMLFDIDGGGTYEQLLSFIPELAGLATLKRPSSSSFIADSAGNELVGAKGLHIYVAVKNLKDVERIAGILWARQWLAKHGHYLLSGGVKPMLLERGIYDKAVLGMPERLAFEAKPLGKNGLMQADFTPHTRIIEGALLDTSIITDLTATELEEVEQLKNAAKEAIEPEHKKAIKQAKRDYIAKTGKTAKDALRDYQKFAKRELTPDFMLHTAKGERLVSSLTAKDDGLTMSDPFEPDYDGGNTTKAKFYWNEGKNPKINSQAHGGILYSLPFLEPVSAKPKSGEAKKTTPATNNGGGDVNANGGDLAGGYPTADQLPCYRVYNDWTRIDDALTLKAGTYLHYAKKNDDGVIVGVFNVRICSPLYIQSVTLDQHGNNHGRFLQFIPTRGGFKKWCMPMALLGGSLDVLKSELLSRGVSFDIDNIKHLPRYLHHFLPKTTLEVATQTGWHKGAYILPETCIGSDDYFYQSENIHADVPYRKAGTLTKWQDNIARYCVGNPLLMLSVCCSFAGALLKPTHQQGGGFHFVGESSRGKSTGLEVACSVFGDGTYKRTWKATGNGMEATAAMFNDGFLALDEISECNPKEVGGIVYQLANGEGKSRANRSGGAKASYQWRVMIVSNGETSIESAMQEGGQRAKAGQLIRMLSIPIFGNYGAFNELHDKQDGRALADHLKTASLNYYGVAGIEYLTKLVAEKRDLCQLAERYTVALIDGDTLSPQESRAAKRFALVALAGELATEYGVTGWKRGDASHGVKQCFNQWRKSFGGGDTEDRHIKEAVQAYVEMYGDARFSNTNSDTRLHGIRSGYWKDDDAGGRVWLFTTSGLMEAVKGYDLKKAVSVLKACGWLMPANDGKPAKPIRINSEVSKFYFIRFAESVTHVTLATNNGLQLQPTNGAGVTHVTHVTPKIAKVQSENSEQIKKTMPVDNRGMV